MALSAFAEILTLGAVIPFITVLVNPEKVMQIGIVADVAGLIGVSQPEDLVVPLALLFIAGAVASAGMRLVLVWATMHLSVVTGADLTAEAYARTLHQPYAIHVRRNTSDVTSGVIHKVDSVVYGMLSPLQTALGSLVTLVSVTAVLVMIEPGLAVIVISAFGGGYLAITRVFRGRLERNSQQIAREQTQVIKAIQEGIGGIREVLIDGTQAVFLDQFRRPDRRMRKAMGSNSVIQQSPRFLMEGLAMVLIVVLVLTLNDRSGGISERLPMIGALVLAGQRLLPIFQQAYTALATVFGSRAQLAEALVMLNQPMPATNVDFTIKPLGIRSQFRFEGVHFRYSEEEPWVLEEFNMTVRPGSRVGIVGATGCGKTTLLDLFMGLLQPVDGSVFVDGELLEGARLQAWQRAIAHVPQHVFLSDSSVAENIAFGVPPNEIDMGRVLEVSQRARVTEFVEKDLQSFNSTVGERGIRLSGGQRQRIGIARALYKQASVLVLDEATSALDNAMERAVMESIADLDRRLTIVIVAHRVSTLSDCDVIYELLGGRVVGQGTFDELMVMSPSFREMAQISERNH